MSELDKAIYLKTIEIVQGKRKGHNMQQEERELKLLLRAKGGKKQCEN